MMPRRHQHHTMSMTWIKGNSTGTLGISKPKDKKEYTLMQASYYWLWLGWCFQLWFDQIELRVVWGSTSSTKNSEQSDHILWWAFSHLVLTGEPPFLLFFVCNKYTKWKLSFCCSMTAWKCSILCEIQGSHGYSTAVPHSKYQHELTCILSFQNENVYNDFVSSPSRLTLQINVWN